MPSDKNVIADTQRIIQRAIGRGIMALTASDVRYFADVTLARMRALEEKVVASGIGALTYDERTLILVAFEAKAHLLHAGICPRSAAA